MTAIVITPTAASTAKTLSSAARAFGLRFGLVNGQRSAAQIRAVERGDGFVGFAGIRHFYEPETARTASIPVCDQCDFFHGSVRFKEASQLSFARAVR